MPVVKVANLEIRRGCGRATGSRTLETRAEVKELQTGDALIFPVPAGVTIKSEMARIRNAINGDSSLYRKYRVVQTKQGEIAVLHRS